MELFGGSFILRGTVCQSASRDRVEVRADACAVCVDGISQGVFDAASVPAAFENLSVVDCGDAFIVPGMTDLHVHAPQYAFRGLGMDLELLDWLNVHAFPEEARYADAAYAVRAYRIFADDLRRSATTRAVIFGTMHVGATVTLMRELEATGLVTRVGKVSMNRNSPDYLTEGTDEAALAAERLWLDTVDAAAFSRTAPIVTPRFTPSCTDELMRGLGVIAAERDLPVQSHLSENPSEVAWVRELCPWSSCYGDTYRRMGLLGHPGAPAIMAHCVYSGEEEAEMLRAAGAYVAHCPQSNEMLASGIAPVRRYMEDGLNVGLGTDVAAGATLSMFRAMADAVAVSKLRWRLADDALAPLTWQEAFWLATRGGGSFFGQVGGFDKGFEFDALVLDDADARCPRELEPLARLERFVYLAEKSGRITRKYVRGTEVL